MGNVMERFWDKVEFSDSTCWEWTASQNRGYGQFWNGERKVKAHRFLFERCIAVVPAGYELDHLCRNRGCVNPYHLEIVTHSENTLRGRLPEIMRQRQLIKTHCPRRHPYDNENTHINPATGARECRACRALAKRRIRGNR